MHELPLNHEAPRENPYIGATTPFTEHKNSSEATPTQGEITVPGPGEVPTPSEMQATNETPPGQTDDGAYTYMPTYQRPLTEVFEDMAENGPVSVSRTLEHIGVLPGNDNIVFRRFPAEHHRYQGMTLPEAERRIAITIEHQTILAGTLERPGIIIPNTYYQAQEQPDGSAHIINITERVDEPPFSISDWAENGMSETEAGTVMQLASTLVGYHDWVLRTKQPMFLADLWSTNQYRLSADNQPILIDTDPYMGIFRTREGWRNLSFSLAGVNGIVNTLPPSPEREILLQKAHRMRAFCSETIQTTLPMLLRYHDRHFDPFHR